MSVVSALRNCSFLRKPLLYLYHKIHNRKLVKFWYSSDFSYRCRFEGMNMIGPRTIFNGTLGYGSFVGGGSFLSAEVGRFTSIGPGCRYINATHAYKEPFATTCPLFFSLHGQTPDGLTFAKKQMTDEFRYYDKERELVNRIGNDCWLGTNVTLIGGVEIADGAVVLANATVTKDIPPYAIVGGVPAKIIGYRYDEETIRFLQKIQWWDNDEEWFKEHWELLCDIENLKEYYKHQAML